MYRVVILVHFPTVRNATAVRLSGSGVVPGFAPAEAAAADWAAAAERRFGAAVVLRPEGGAVLAVSAEPHVLQVRSLTLHSWTGQYSTCPEDLMLPAQSSTSQQQCRDMLHNMQDL